MRNHGKNKLNISDGYVILYYCQKSNHQFIIDLHILGIYITGNICEHKFSLITKLLK